MKKNYLVTCLGFLFIGVSIFSACEGPEGPMGPAGANGTNGINGTNGTSGTNGTNGKDGQDGTTTCIVCHSKDQSLYAREIQWANSKHGTGLNFERNGGECAICHTSQGFRGNLNGSYVYTVTGAKILNPNPPNCYACHKIHETYTSADLALTVPAGTPITLRNTALKHDFGKGNVCATCHQGRTVTPFPVAGGADIVVSSTRYGVHHGPQSNVLAGVGKGLFEVGTGLENSVHSTLIPNACVTCHMSEAYGIQSGGHTMWMAYEYHGSEVLNQKGCKIAGCHNEATNVQALTATSQATITALLAELKIKLDAAGITKDGSDDSVSGTYSALVAGACLDYKALTEDKSLGVHNPRYVKKLLENLIAAL